MDFEVITDYNLIEQEAAAQYAEYDADTNCIDETGICLFRDSFFSVNHFNKED